MLTLKRGVAAAAMAFGLFVGSVSAAPLEVYGRLPSMESVDISPDGSAVVLIANVGDDRVVIARALTGAVLAQLPVGQKKVRSVDWADNDHVVVVVSSTAVVDRVSTVGEMFQAVSLNVRTGKTTQLPTSTKSHDAIVNVVQGALRPTVLGGKTVIVTPLFVTVAGNMQEKSSHLDLYRIDLDSGQAERMQMGDYNTRAYLTKADGSIVARASREERERQRDVLWTLQLRRGSDWQTVFQTNQAIETPDLWGLSADGESVILDTYDEKQKIWRPTPVSLADGKLGDYIGPAVQQGAKIGRDGTVLAFTHRETFVEYDFVEPRLKAAWAKVRPAFAGRQLSLLSWTPDFNKLVVMADGGTETGGYYIVDIAAKKADPIGAAYRVPANEVAEVKAIKYRAADGLEIEGFLTLPRGRAATALPLVVLPHGGPRSQDVFRFDWMAQGLASRGYAVLQPNFRGSSGYGQDFIEAGYGEWGRKMQTDLSDGVAHLVKEGVVDAKRVCIMGASYGGYAALAGVTLQKGVYRCSVAIAGVADLSKMMRDDALLYGAESPMQRDQKRLFAVDNAGDPKLGQRSPLQNAAAADAPILLIHGRDDTVVPYGQSSAMSQALKNAGKSFELVTLPSEDHWMSRSGTRLQMLSASVAFIEKNNPPN